MKGTLIAALLAVSLVAGCGSDEASNGGTTDTTAENSAAGTTSAGEATLPGRIATGRIPQPRLETRPVVIEGSRGEVRVRAEIADSFSESTRGLMAREKLGENRGMLFVYGEERSLRFIMDNTIIPLSIAYIDSGGRIVDIQDMQPRSGESYPSAEPARYALEVNQGFFEENGVEVGDSVDLPGAVTGG